MSDRLKRPTATAVRPDHRAQHSQWHA